MTRCYADEVGQCDDAPARPPAKEDKTLAHTEQAVAAPAAEGRSARSATPDGGESLLETIMASLEDDKAEDIVAIDLRGRSPMADHMVVCSGRSSRQVSAIAEKLIDRLKERYGFTARSEGGDTGDWVLIDAGDAIVHVFRPEVRDFYQLEKMWTPAGATAGPRGAG